MYVSMYVHMYYECMYVCIYVRMCAFVCMCVQCICMHDVHTDENASFVPKDMFQSKVGNQIDLNKNLATPCSQTSAKVQRQSLTVIPKSGKYTTVRSTLALWFLH